MNKNEAIQGRVISCPVVWEEMSMADYYVADIENFIVSIKHTMKASQFFEDSDYDPYYSQSNEDMDGAFLVKDKKGTRAIKRFPKGRVDNFTINEILEGAGHKQGLDSPSVNEFGNTSFPQTLRDEGIQIQVDLRYTNTLCRGLLSCAFGVGNVKYGYFMNTIPHADYKVVTIDNTSPTARTKTIKRGILVKTIQAGKIGRFSFHVLLVNICSALGLSTLATTLVDALGTFALPRRNLFNAVKYKDVYLDEVAKTLQQEENKKKE